MYLTVLDFIPFSYYIFRSCSHDEGRTNSEEKQNISYLEIPSKYLPVLIIFVQKLIERFIDALRRGSHRIWNKVTGAVTGSETRSQGRSPDLKQGLRGGHRIWNKITGAVKGYETTNKAAGAVTVYETTFQGQTQDLKHI